MTSKLLLQKLQFNNDVIELYVPDASHVQNIYLQQLKDNPSLPSPYWTQIWPASFAMAEFLVNNTNYIDNKKVLELAAGMGLPSFIASKYAAEILCSDYLQEAVDVIQQSINYNKLTNVQSALLNWNSLPKEITADILLLSDINYEPSSFEILFNVLQQFLLSDATIILSTPQRIMAKPFIERLLPWCIEQQEIPVQQEQKIVLTTVLVLQRV